ncbi:MAG: tetratricopeptide repeat protein [Pirellulales bacterium]
MSSSYSAVITLAEQAVRLQADNRQYRITLAALLYRNGRHQEALSQLQTALAMDGPIGASHAVAWCFLAMAHYDVGDREKANQWLTKAVEWMDAACRDEEENGAIPVTWERRLTLDLLRGETEELLNVAVADAQPKSRTDKDPEPDEPNSEAIRPSTEQEETTHEE